MENIKTLFKKHLPSAIFDEPLSKYSTFQIGGPADVFYKAKTIEIIPSIVKFCKTKHIPILIFGGGSNILFHDKGFRGLVVKMEADNIEIKDDRIKADAGVTISKLINETIKHGLTGFELWIGLPGTVGGAVRGNAGCNGLAVKDVLVNAKLMDLKTGNAKNASNKYFHFDYRHSRIKDNNEIILTATFKAKKRDFPVSEQKKIMTEMRRLRAAKQPFGKTTGSFFKNPSPDTPAGMLIEQSGLKGKTIGKAKISEKHANFFMNLGGATAKDILKLAQLAKKRVKAKFGITLEEEVRIVPEILAR